MIISEHNDLWYRCRPFVERKVGNLLEEYFDLSSINYYKIPWTGIEREGREITVPRIDNRFPSITMCQFSNPRKFIQTFEKLGITDVFSPHCDSDKIGSIRAHPIAHQPINCVGNPIHILTRPILYSFVGVINSPIREELSKMKHPLDSMMIYRDKWNHESYAGSKDGAFKRSLQCSKFVLCPRGWGVGTVRFWEALKSGCIPVIFDDIKLPQGSPWGSMVIKHVEGLKSLEDHLRSFSASEITQRQGLGVRLASKFLGDNIIRPIIQQFKLAKADRFYNR